MDDSNALQLQWVRSELNHLVQRRLAGWLTVDEQLRWDHLVELELSLLAAAAREPAQR